MSAKRKANRPQTRSAIKPHPTEARRSDPANRLTIPLLAALIVAAGAWAYANSFRGVLVLDDLRAIVHNQTIRTLSPLSTPLSPPTASTVAGRPIANLSFAINYAFAPADAREVFAPGPAGAPPDTTDRFRRNVWGYHVGNLLIHLGAALLLFGIVRRTLLTDRLRPLFGVAAPWLAVATAAIWVVHPLQTESVSYLVQRVESLAGLFYLATLYCAIRASGASRPAGWMAGAIVSCALGMATKEVMVTAPLVVWLWQMTFVPRTEAGRRWPLIAGLAATWLILAVLVFYEHRGPSIDLNTSVVWRYLLTQAEVILHYVRLAIVPAPLVFLYTWPLAPSLGAVALEVAIVAAVALLTVFALVRRHPLGFLGAWFFLVLAPTSSVLPIVTEVAAEHRMYLPLAAIVAAVVAGGFLAARALLAKASGANRSSRLAAAVALLITVALVLVLASTTRARNEDYTSAEALWADTVARQPDNQRAWAAYGAALALERRLPEAASRFQKAVELAPNDPVALSRLGGVEVSLGQIDSGITHLERAVTLNPDDVGSYRWLGEAYARRGDDRRAVVHLERALAAQPDNVALLVQLATILADSRTPMVKDPGRAAQLAERAATLTGRRNADVLNVLAVAQAGLGHYREAATTANEGLSLARAEGNRALASELEYRATAYGAREK